MNRKIIPPSSGHSDPFNYKRRKSSVVSIGNTPLGGKYPVRLQSMTNTSTMDTRGSIDQCIRIIDAGGEYVRLTAQGVREAENLQYIESGLCAKGYSTPLIADIHFNSNAAGVAAGIVEKVRINPGNFADPVKTFKTFEYTDQEYALEIEKIKEKFIPFLNICKEHQTAIRIGVNHGSLSDRIMSRFGDTPEGMVESCMEFLRICIDEKFHDIVISIKASNTSVMVRTVRLLVLRMNEENMYFPLHLGVTEAGDGEDGRIKSAVGIGTLLSEGIGDTIRVSLSEDPEFEIPVAKTLVDYINKRTGHTFINGKKSLGYNSVNPLRRGTKPVNQIGGSHVPIVISNRTSGDCAFDPQFIPDFSYIGKKGSSGCPSSMSIIVDYSNYSEQENTYPLFHPDELDFLIKHQKGLKFLTLFYDDWNDKIASALQVDEEIVIILSTNHLNGTGEQLAFIHQLLNLDIKNPVIVHRTYDEPNINNIRIKSGADLGPLLLDMMADGIFISGNKVSPQMLDVCSFGLLQASGRRISKTEYISCPGCGRTLFDLQTTIKKVKLKTSHLKGLKIGIMGCIVNGPGEMADADYGYVGAGLGKISLYKGKTCVEKNIREEAAVESLIELIKTNGDWIDEDFQS